MLKLYILLDYNMYIRIEFENIESDETKETRQILEKNTDKINWYEFSKNRGIFVHI